MVARGEVYSIEVPGKSGGRTGWFGMNLSASTFGVSCVWINIVLAVNDACAGIVATVWHSAFRFGRLRACDGVIAGILVAL